MGTSMLTLSILCFGAFLDVSSGARFLLAVPKEPHYDMNFKATVTATGIYAKEAVTLEYRPGKDTSRVLNWTRLEFEFDGVQSWGVTFPWEKMQLLDETSIWLYMTSERNGQTQKIRLHFSESSGYIFIQTDKPVYTPKQTVKFRILAVDEYQKLAKYPLKVDIKNEQDVVVDRLRYSAEEAFQGQEFELPKESGPGRWSITANYEGPFNTEGTSETVTFEVKEYVLPRFYASLEIDKEVITPGDSWVSFTVTAKYVYGRPVMGFMEMQLGLWDSMSGVQLLPVRMADELEKGKSVVNIRTNQLFPKNATFPKNKRLYVNVNVTEAGTWENDTIEDTSTFIDHPYYDITFQSSKANFKPGFPYTLRVQVKAKSGTPASWVYLYVKAKFMDGNNRHLSGKNVLKKLDGNGMQTYDFETPPDASTIKFETDVFDLQHRSQATFTVRKFFSPKSQYLHIAMDRGVQRFRDGQILLRYTPPEDSWYGGSDAINIITVLVIARGQVVHTTNTVRSLDGRSLVSLPRNLSSELTPSMRVVAYYQEGSEIVMDSLLVDTPDVCLEEVSIQRPGGYFGRRLMVKPKDKYTLNVRGGAHMKVGLVAVDKAVLLVNNEVTLSRESMFQQLGSHDQGVGSGDGLNAEEIFKHSGLIHRIIDSSKRDDSDTASVSRLEGIFGNVPIRGTSFNKGPTGPKEPSVVITQSELLDHIKKTGQGLFVGEAPPQTVRRYFPESWLFEEHTLGKDGLLKVNTTLPDSITTWSFMAVGISSTRGVCVSRTHEEKTEKTFFADLRMPYKVTRLEEVKVKIAVYNYKLQNITLFGRVSGSDGLCFPTEDVNFNQQNGTFFNLTIPKLDARTVEVKLIPLRNGELTVRADLSVHNSHDRDVVERKLFVVAEGQRIKKSITFVLDPEAKHAKYRRARRNKIILSKTSTVSNVFDLRKKEQKTKIDLALPKEVIYGTESCSISAFGDLMGDIISHAVIQSKSLLDQPVLDAEEVLGDLSPTVHALIYANLTGLMDSKLQKRGHRFVKHAVTRLLRYRNGHAFSLTSESQPATWLTAFAVKTLCHSSKVTFVDPETLIKYSFTWLLNQISENGTLEEQDWRLANDSLEYRTMLAAEVLIALLECDLPEKESRMTLEGELGFFLEDVVAYVTRPMVLAKVTYALTLFDAKGEIAQEAVKRLLAMKRRNKLGQSYWSEEVVTNEPRRLPFWYRRGAKASSIEATAYALMVFLRHGRTSTDAIADWLVSQRNANGAFIGAMDSAAAIQALSAYSLSKHDIGVDLLCDVGSDRHKDYRHSFKFTEKNATNVDSVNDVPVGQVLQVSTTGKGLGQMQVNLEYNIPLDKNERCPFNITIDVKPTVVRWTEDMYTNPLCSSCNIGCVEKDNETDSNSTTTAPSNTTTTAQPQLTRSRTRVEAVYPADARNRLRKHRRPNKRLSHRRRGQRTKRTTQSLRFHNAASKKSICFHMCLQHLEDEDYGPVTMEIEMLTGYVPVGDDITRLKASPGVRGVEYEPETEILTVHLSWVPGNDSTCVAFRAVDEMEVNRPTPANVLVKEVGNPYPICSQKYEPVHDQQSLQVYCADPSHTNRGECRCYSGLCGRCHPLTNDELDLHQTKQMACFADIAYQLQINDVKATNQWVEIDAKVLSVNKTAGSHSLRHGDVIQLMTPAACYCPIYEYKDRAEAFYLLSADVAKLMDRYGKTKYRYLLDHNSRILRVTEPRQRYHVSRKPAVKWDFLEQALGPFNRC